MSSLDIATGDAIKAMTQKRVQLIKKGSTWLKLLTITFVVQNIIEEIETMEMPMKGLQHVKTWSMFQLTMITKQRAFSKKHEGIWHEQFLVNIDRES